jgi:hypothetical protein
LSANAGAKQTLFRMLQAELPQTHKFVEAADKVQNEIIDKDPELQQMFTDFAKIKVSMEDGRTRIEKFETEFGNLAKIVTGLGGSPDELLGRISTAKRTWTSDCLATLDVGVADTAKQTVLAALATIKQDFDKLINNDGGSLDTNKQDTAKQANRAKFDELAAATVKAIKSLALDDKSKAGGFAGELTTLKNAAQFEASDKNVTDLEALKEKVDKGARDIAKDVGDRSKEVRKKLGILRKLIDALAKKNKDYKAFFDSMYDKLTDCEGLANSSLIRVIERAEQAVARLEPEINGLNTELNQKKGPANFEAVEKKTKELLEKISKDKNLQKCMPQRQKVLEYRLEKDLKKQLLGMSPEKGLAELQKFDDNQIGPAADEALTAASKREKLIEDGKKLKTEAAKLTDAPRLMQELVGRIDSAMSPAEGSEANSRLELDKVERLITSALDNPDTLADLEQKAYDNAFEQERNKNAWDAETDIFEKNEQRNAKSAYDGTDSNSRDDQRYKEIDRHYSSAKKQAKNGNYTVARDDLYQATRAARDFIQNPLGGRTSERKNLQKVYNRWKSAIGSYLGQIENVKSAVRKDVDLANKEATDQSNPAPYDLAKIDSVIDRLYRIFDARMFDQPIKVLTAEDSSLTACRRERESALNNLRGYRELLSNDRLLAYVRTNPFFTDFSTRPIQDAIADFELNLLRSTY